MGVAAKLHSPRRSYPDGRGQCATITYAATAWTARCQTSTGVAPSMRIRFSLPLLPSTCQTVRPLEPVKAASPSATILTADADPERG